MKKIIFLAIAAAITFISATEYSKETVKIDGVDWMKYDLGASESNLNGAYFNLEEAKTACPEGFRLPSKEDFKNVSQNASSWISSNKGVAGRWFSGRQEFNRTVPAIYLTCYAENTGGVYWTSEEEKDGNGILYVFSDEERYYYDFGEMIISARAHVRCIKVKDAEIRQIEGKTTVIDGKTWLNYNVGADANNLCGTSIDCDNSYYACPNGYRLPTKKELESLAAHHSEYIDYNYTGTKGFWLSGSKPYSPSVPAIFIPQRGIDGDIDLSHGHYWSSTEDEETSTYAVHYWGLSLYAGRVGMEDIDLTLLGREHKASVRCIKE